MNKSRFTFKPWRPEVLDEIRRKILGGHGVEMSEAMALMMSEAIDEFDRLEARIAEMEGVAGQQGADRQSAIIQAAFMESYLNALPDGWAKDESSMNAVLGRAIATGLAAAIERWEKR